MTEKEAKERAARLEEKRREARRQLESSVEAMAESMLTIAGSLAIQRDISTAEALEAVKAAAIIQAASIIYDRL